MQGMNPQYQQPQIPTQMPPPMPTNSGVPVWVWILVGLLALFMMAGVAVVATGVFFAKQAANNPVAMVAKIAAMANPNIEVVAVDEATGKVTIKDRETGKTVTVSLDDLKQGKLEVSSEEGKIQMGANVDAKIPPWVPVYPGAKQQNLMSTQTAEADGGTILLEVKEEFGKVKAWYEDQIKAQGFESKMVTSTEGSEGPGAMLIASKNDERQSLHIILNTEPEFTRATITFGSKK